MKKFFNLFSLLLLITVTSCVSSRSMTYLLDMEYDTKYPVTTQPDIKVQKGDKLQISVFSDDAALTAPFNPTAGLKEDPQSTMVTYTVDNYGNIDFPVLGNVYVEGMSPKELQKHLEEKITESGYIKKPIVNVKLDNFIITIIGSSGNSVLKMDRDNVNILQAVAMAGGTNENDIINDVMLIRTQNGVREAYSVNLQSKDLFDSPAFYLQQDDVLYIKPKGGFLSRTTNTGIRIFGLAISVLNVITSVLLVTSLSE